MSTQQCAVCHATGNFHLCSTENCPEKFARHVAGLIPIRPSSETIVGFAERDCPKPETNRAFSESPSLGVVRAVKQAIADHLALGSEVDDWILYTEWNARMAFGTTGRSSDRTDFTIMRLCGHFDPRVAERFRCGVFDKPLHAPVWP